MTSVARRLGRVVPLPNLRLTLQPPRLSRDDLARGVDEVVFRADPRVTKLEVRAYLERALRVKTTDVRTSNYDGAKRRDRGGFHRRAAFKKVYVTLGERWFPLEAFRAKDARERDDDARARRASARAGGST